MNSTSTPQDRPEELLASLTGIVSAHVVANGEGRITEIHVLAAPELHPKQVVRNVESALSAGLGIEIDRRIVSVAQMRPDADDPDPADAASAAPPAANATARASRRLEFVRFSARRDARHGATCDVVLRDGEHEITGSGSGAVTEDGRAGAAAAAVLDALDRARPGHGLALEGVVVTRAGDRRLVLVAARGLDGRASVPLAGAASLTRSPEEAGIIAALQATNRWHEAPDAAD